MSSRGLLGEGPALAETGWGERWSYGQETQWATQPGWVGARTSLQGSVPTSSRSCVRWVAGFPPSANPMGSVHCLDEIRVFLRPLSSPIFKMFNAHVLRKA